MCTYMYVYVYTYVCVYIYCMYVVVHVYTYTASFTISFSLSSFSECSINFNGQITNDYAHLSSFLTACDSNIYFQPGPPVITLVQVQTVFINFYSPPQHTVIYYFNVLRLLFSITLYRLSHMCVRACAHACVCVRNIYSVV